MKRILIVFCIILFSELSSYCQYYDPNAAKSSSNVKAPKSGWDWNKVYPGGNFGLGISKNSFYVLISPLAGYKINSWFSSGLILTFAYFNATIPLRNSFTGQTLNENFSGSVYGISPFARAIIFKWIVLQTEIGLANAKCAILDEETNAYLGQDRKWLFSPLVGGGINVPLGDKSGLILLIMVNLNFKSNYFTYGVNQQFVSRIGFYF